MKSIMRRIDRYCALHPSFGIKNLILYIIIGNAVVWLFGMMDTTNTLRSLLMFSAEAIFTQGQVWRLLTFILVPSGGSGLLFFITLYFYYFIGSTLEQYWGKGKFTIYYLCGMLFNILFGIVAWLLSGKDVTVTTLYINLSMFFAFATLFPETRVLLFFIIPVKIKWLAYFDAALFLYAVITTSFPANLLPIVAILNYLLFCGGWLFDFIRPARFEQKKKTIDFKKAAKKYNQEQAKKPYTRKCEVCGRTDVSDPNMEFRFCSKCGGYHCFCIDHINSHVHFKE
ncbi:MAG: hypothetical protein EOM51_07740 [Clostridia bacterium]|nr:hypothetical protein [Clostridia bacterium]